MAAPEGGSSSGPVSIFLNAARATVYLYGGERARRAPRDVSSSHLLGGFAGIGDDFEAQDALEAVQFHNQRVEQMVASACSSARWEHAQPSLKDTRISACVTALNVAWRTQLMALEEAFASGGDTATTALSSVPSMHVRSGTLKRGDAKHEAVVRLLAYRYLAEHVHDSLVALVFAYKGVRPSRARVVQAAADMLALCMCANAMMCTLRSLVYSTLGLAQHPSSPVPNPFPRHMLPALAAKFGKINDRWLAEAVERGSVACHGIASMQLVLLTHVSALVGTPAHVCDAVRRFISSSPPAPAKPTMRERLVVAWQLAVAVTAAAPRPDPPERVRLSVADLKSVMTSIFPLHPGASQEALMSGVRLVLQGKQSKAAPGSVQASVSAVVQAGLDAITHATTRPDPLLDVLSARHEVGEWEWPLLTTEEQTARGELLSVIDALSSMEGTASTKQ